MELERYYLRLHVTTRKVSTKEYLIESCKFGDQAKVTKEIEKRETGKGAIIAYHNQWGSVSKTCKEMMEKRGSKGWVDLFGTKATKGVRTRNLCCKGFLRW